VNTKYLFGLILLFASTGCAVHNNRAIDIEVDQLVQRQAYMDTQMAIARQQLEDMRDMCLDQSHRTAAQK
jgi:hypothetical protein